jgi:chromate reductase
MKIVVMIGSLRKDSYHRKLFETYRSQIEADVEFYQIPTTDFPHYNSDLETPAVITEHSAQLDQSDAIIFFTPEYNYSIPGHLKNALDWLSRQKTLPFGGKKAAIISATPGNVGGARMQYELRKVGVYLDLHFLNKPEIMIGKMHDKFNQNGQLIDDETLDFLHKHQQAFVNFINS